MNRVCAIQSDIRTDSGQNRRKESTACNELQIYMYIALRSEFIIHQATNDLRLVTSGYIPCGHELIRFNGIRTAQRVVICKEASHEHFDFMSKTLEEIGVGFRELFRRALNQNIIQFQRLILYIGNPCSESTHIVFEVGEILCNLVLVRAHFLKKNRNLLQCSGVLTLNAVHIFQIINDFIEIDALQNHGLDCIRHNTSKAVVAVLVRSRTG